MLISSNKERDATKAQGKKVMRNTEFMFLKSKLKGFANEYKIITIQEYIEGLELTKRQLKIIDHIIEDSKLMYKNHYGVSWDEDNDF